MPRGWTRPPSLRSPTADDLLEGCREVLTEQGLDLRQSLPLSCCSAQECWRGHQVPTDPVLPRLPWVGPRYHDSRVLVVGLNAQTHAGLWDESYCVHRACEQLALGRQRFFGADGRSTSWFHYRAAVVASLLLDLVRGEPAQIREPAACIDALMGSARVQTVQCAPSRDARRAPTGAMLRRCPDLGLWPMVERLAPRVIATVGAEARRALERRYQIALEPCGPLLFAGRLGDEQHGALVFALRHPSSGFGMQSIHALQDLINRADIRISARGV